MHVLGEIESVLEADLVAETLLLNPLPNFLHTGTSLDDGVFRTRDIAAVDGDVKLRVTGFDGDPVGNGVGSRDASFEVGGAGS